MSPSKFSIASAVVVCLTVGLPFASFSQIIYGSFTNLCPGRSYHYTFSGCTNPQWAVNNGRLDHSGSDFFDITWFDVATGGFTLFCSEGPDPQTVTILNNPTPVIYGPANIYVCGAGSLTLTASATINTSSYIWQIPSGFSAPGGTTTTTPQITVNYTSIAHGLIKVASVNSCTNHQQSAFSDSVFVQQRQATNPTSISKSSSNYEICSGESWTLTCNDGAQGTNFGYDWYIYYVGSGAGVLLNGSTTSQTTPLHTAT